MYQEGVGTIRDMQLAVELFQLAADQGQDYAQTHLAMCYLYGDGVPGDARLAAKWFKSAAELGNLDAQNDYAVCLMSGHGVPRDEELAISWVTKSAEAGSVIFMMNLYEYYSLEGAHSNIKLALKWCKKAALKGSADAHVELAVRYQRGDGVDGCAQMAYEHYFKAAKLGHTVAQFNTGVCLVMAVEWHKNPVMVVEWYKNPVMGVECYKKAIDSRVPNAMFNLGTCYQLGRGVPVDMKTPFKWYLRAAEHGHLNAMHNVGFSCQSGIGTSQNLEQAVEWYGKPASFGKCDSQSNLGMCYMCYLSGSGVTRNQRLGIEWVTKAASQGYPKAVDILKSMGIDAPPSSSPYVPHTLGTAPSSNDIYAMAFYRANSDSVSVFKLFLDSAKLGHAKAQFRVARCYERGIGVFRDEYNAVKWYLKAAASGHVMAMHGLVSLCYRERLNYADDDV